MSEVMSSQKMQRTCEGCGITKEWELVGATDESILEMQEWYMITRGVLVNGRFEKWSVNACSLPCVSIAVLRLAAPQGEPADNIDLNSLRAGNLSN